MKPVIGVTTSYLEDKGISYQRIDLRNIKAIESQGAIPFILYQTLDLTIIRQYMDWIDGIYFSGGCDIWPALFGEEPEVGIKTVYPERDQFEIALYKIAEKKDMPVFGVCRGAQLMNVAAGGSLIQDIQKQVVNPLDHSSSGIPGRHPYHQVKLKENSLIRQMLIEQVMGVNSHHHQSVKKLGEGYEVSAFSKDGVIEAIESKNMTFSLGVQWHPEEMYETYPVFKNLYHRFVEESSSYRLHRK